MTRISKVYRAADPTFVLRARCPGCGTLASFDPTPADDLLYADRDGPHNGSAGLRICPNPQCRTLVMFSGGGRPDEGATLATYPADDVDFDATGVPAAVADALNEAITCYRTGSFVAAGIMVRKMLEELCEDQKATGARLVDRLKSLHTQVILPPALFDVMDHLRLLGNDAAHIKLTTFRQIGKDEIDVSIEIARRVLEAVYGYGDLMARIDKLKAP